MPRHASTGPRHWPLLLGALLLLAAGPLHAAPGDAGLAGSAWRLVALPGATLLPGVTVSLLLGEGVASGSDGCNRYRLPYTVAEGVLHFSGRAIATQMACPPDVMRLASAYHDALERTDSGRIEADRLLLRDAGNGVVAEFERQDRRLHTTSWAVTGYNNGRGGVVSLLAGTELTLRLDEDGRLGGSAGCNRYTGSYHIDGDAIRIEPPASTRRLCASPDGIMDQEAAFLAALPRAGRWEVFDDRLELRDAGGALQVQATRQPSGMNGTAGHGGNDAVGATLALPATFTGDLPCADCEAIRHHLDLWPDGVFHLQRTWIAPARADADLRVDRIGRWTRDPERNVLRLQGAEPDTLWFAVEGPDRLRALDRHGQAIVSDLPYTLRSNGVLEPAPMELPLGGELRYLADAALLTECLTGRRYPVAMEADWPAAERAYLATVDEPGGLLHVTFDGAIVERPPMEGDGSVPTVVVRRFIGAWPDQRCERARAQASLQDTYWRLVRIGDREVSVTPGHREPHVVLSSGERPGYRATVGCNSLRGGYRVSGDRIDFARPAMTRMACPPPLDDLERQMLDVLARAAGWRIVINGLELFDESGEPVALFTAVYL